MSAACCLPFLEPRFPVNQCGSVARSGREGENGVQVRYPLMHCLGQGKEILLSGIQGSSKCCSPPPRTLEQPGRKGASTKSWRLDFLLNLEGGEGRGLMGLRKK